jgi:hypothetical protein
MGMKRRIIANFVFFLILVAVNGAIYFAFTTLNPGVDYSMPFYFGMGAATFFAVLAFSLSKNMW